MLKSKKFLDLNKPGHSVYVWRCGHFAHAMRSLTPLSLSTHTHYGMALFRSKNFLDFNTVTISFLFNKNYLIIK